MENQSSKNYQDFYRLDKETRGIYYDLQKSTGLSDGEFWCMMAVRFYECNYPHEICTSMCMSKQTIHSALKQLVKKEFITLVTQETNLRMKQIVFTEKGALFLEEHLVPIANVERAAWMRLTLEEQEELIRLTAKLNRHFRAETDNFLQK